MPFMPLVQAIITPGRNSIVLYFVFNFLLYLEYYFPVTSNPPIKRFFFLHWLLVWNGILYSQSSEIAVSKLQNLVINVNLLVSSYFLFIQVQRRRGASVPIAHFLNTRRSYGGGFTEWSWVDIWSTRSLHRRCLLRWETIQCECCTSCLDW